MSTTLFRDSSLTRLPELAKPTFVRRELSENMLEAGAADDDWGPSDPGFSLREQYLKSSLNYDTPEEQNKRLQFASILVWIKENAFAGRQSLNRSSSSAQIGSPGFAERSRSLSVTAKV
jgi:hypothetical protein